MCTSAMVGELSIVQRTVLTLHNAYMLTCLLFTYHTACYINRHSQVDWGRPNLKKYPLFSEVQASEVLLRAGEVRSIMIYKPYAYRLHNALLLRTCTAQTACAECWLIQSCAQWQSLKRYMHSSADLCCSSTWCACLVCVPYGHCAPASMTHVILQCCYCTLITRTTL
jgi:hypothetical protein